MNHLKNKIEKDLSLNGFIRELQRIYKELDEELAKNSPGCNACGECCNFDRFNHILYTTMIEVDYIKRNVSVPQNHSDKNICPFLTNQKCTIRDYRTLGCRVFYCSPDYNQNISHEIYNKYYSKIKDLSHTHDLKWRYAPFLQLLYQESK